MSSGNHRQIIKNFQAKAAKKRSFSDKFADYLTSTFGTFQFLAINLVIFVIWIVLNLGLVPSVAIFDPFPFPMLTTIVSLEAIVLSIVVLISQSREEAINTLREEFHMNINLIAEREITRTLRLVHEIAKKHGIKVDDPEITKMLEDLDQSYIEKRLQEELAPSPHNLAQTIAQPLIDVAEKVEEKLINRNS